jgi:hypothetical protein
MCKTTVLPIALYWCETLSLTPREEQRLRVFENREKVKVKSKGKVVPVL